MKFPSFIKTSKYGRFNYDPRYYDPVKEEIRGKLAAAKRHANMDKKDAEEYSSHISAAFSKRERKSNRSSAVQMVIAALLLGTFVGWLYLGNDFLYVYILLMPAYFYFRIKKKANKEP